MRASIATGACILGSLALGCGTAPPPSGAPPVAGTATVAPPATAEPTAVAQAEPPPDDGTGLLVWHPVQHIWSLFDVVATDGTLEVRVGFDPGGGLMGRFRYAPVVNGVVQLAEETSEIGHADTTGGILEIAGKRPDLLLHIASGFRSAAVDRYWVLGEDNQWKSYDGYRPGGASTGVGFQSWTPGNLIEWRSPPYGTSDARLPEIGLVRGPAKEAPSLTRALEKRLVKEGFMVESYRAFPTGEVLVVGSADPGKSFGTLVWKDKPKEPTYFVTEPANGLAKDAALTVLGGNSLADVRLQAGDAVMKYDGAAWVTESTVPKDGLPDVWFGSTIVLANKAGSFARFTKGGTWRKVGGQYDSIVVDAAGVLWTTDGDGTLMSSKAPAAPSNDVTEEDLVKARKASILRGGSRDATGQGPSEYSPTCSMSYVLLDSIKGISDVDDYAAIRRALAGHREFASAKFIVSRERGRQFFGALLGDEEAAKKLEKVVTKAIKGSIATALCAEPPSVREVRIDLKTGDLLK